MNRDNPDAVTADEYPFLGPAISPRERTTIPLPGAEDEIVAPFVRHASAAPDTTSEAVEEAEENSSPATSPSDDFPWLLPAEPEGLPTSTEAFAGQPDPAVVEGQRDELPLPEALPDSLGEGGPVELAFGEERVDSGTEFAAVSDFLWDDEEGARDGELAALEAESGAGEGVEEGLPAAPGWLWEEAASPALDEGDLEEGVLEGLAFGDSSLDDATLDGLGPDGLAVGEPVSEETAFSEPVMNEPAFGEPAFGRSAVGETAFGESALGEPALGEPVIDELAVAGVEFEEPGLDESREPMLGESAADELVLDEGAEAVPWGTGPGDLAPGEEPGAGPQEQFAGERFDAPLQQAAATPQPGTEASNAPLDAAALPIGEWEDTSPLVEVEDAVPHAVEVEDSPTPLEEVATRLERIAQSLRSGNPVDAFDRGDPLQLLITGYALGYSEARRTREST